MIAFLDRLNRIASIRTWAMFMAGPFLLLFAVWLVFLIRNGWPLNQASRQLDILGKALWIVLATNAVIIVALAAARVRAGGPGGSSIEISSDGEPPRPSQPAVRTTTTTEVKP